MRSTLFYFIVCIIIISSPKTQSQSPVDKMPKKYSSSSFKKQNITDLYKMCCDKMKDFFYLKQMVKIFKKAKMSFYLTDLMC